MHATTSQARQECVAKQATRLTGYHRPASAPDDHPRDKLGKQIQPDGTPRHDFPPFEALVPKVNAIWPMCENAPEAVRSIVGLIENSTMHSAKPRDCTPK